MRDEIGWIADRPRDKRDDLELNRTIISESCDNCWDVHIGRAMADRMACGAIELFSEGMMEMGGLYGIEADRTNHCKKGHPPGPGGHPLRGKCGKLVPFSRSSSRDHTCSFERQPYFRQVYQCPWQGFYSRLGTRYKANRLGNWPGNHFVFPRHVQKKIWSKTISAQSP